MPTYMFVCECGARFEETCPVAEMKTSMRCECGKTADRDFCGEFGTRRLGESAFKGHISEAMAVHPSEVAQTIEEDRSIGSMASKYLPDGRLVFDSMLQLRKYQRDRQMIDRNSFFG